VSKEILDEDLRPDLRASACMRLWSLRMLTLSGIKQVIKHTQAGHRRQCSSAWAVQSKARRNGPGTTEWACLGSQATMFKCVGCAEQSKTQWARHD
jgi:hypothetical protein